MYYMLLDCLFNYTATTEIYNDVHTLSLHDALPISKTCTSTSTAPGSRPMVRARSCSRIVIRGLPTGSKPPATNAAPCACAGSARASMSIQPRKSSSTIHSTRHSQGRSPHDADHLDRKRVVQGRVWTVRVTLGGARSVKKKKT